VRKLVPVIGVGGIQRNRFADGFIGGLKLARFEMTMDISRCAKPSFGLPAKTFQDVWLRLPPCAPDLSRIARPPGAPEDFQVPWRAIPTKRASDRSHCLEDMNRCVRIP
jgi:hypothetical protein